MCRDFSVTVYNNFITKEGHFTTQTKMKLLQIRLLNLNTPRATLFAAGDGMHEPSASCSPPREGGGELPTSHGDVEFADKNKV